MVKINRYNANIIDHQLKNYLFIILSINEGTAKKA